MTLDQIRGFIEVAHCLNFSRAAQNLYIAQPNLSRSIAAMEKELNARLFVRSSRGVSLTKAGEDLLGRIEPPFRQVEAALLQTSSSQPDTLRLGISEGADFIAGLREIIYNFNRGEGGCKLIFDRETHLDLRQKLISGDCDIILTTEGDLDSNPEIQYEVIRRSNTLVALHADNPKSARPHFTTADFAGEQLFLLRSPSLQRDDFQAFRDQIVQYDSLGSILTNVDAGQGIAVIPDHISVEQYQNIRTVPYVDDTTGTNLCIGWNAGSQNPLARRTAKELVRQFRERQV